MDLVWLGSEASYMVIDKFAEQYKFDKEAFSRSPFDSDVHVGTDQVFGVKEDRIGLYLLEKVGETVVLKIHGSLVPSYSRWQSWFPGEATSYEAIKDALQIIAESGNKKVLMDVNSGGGAVRGLDTVTTLMKKLRTSGVRMDAHSDGAACSAAYWMMSSARQLTASKMAEVGNIGTMAVVRTYVNTEQTQGVKYTVIKAGKYKAIGSPYQELTAADEAYLQKNIDDTNKFFLDHVSVNRNLMVSDTDKWAEGQTFFAAQAVSAGLIDKVTTLDDLIGSGVPANNQSDNRRFEMNISAEKLAQIEAGADPKAVLNDAEFAHYTKQLSDAIAEQAEAEKVAKDAADALALAEANKTAEPAPTAEGAGMAKEYGEALKLNGRLEAQLELAKDQLTAANERVTKAEADLTALMTVAQHGVQKLQVALQKPVEAKSTPAEVLAQFTDLQSVMAARFPTSQRSLPASVEDTTNVASSAHTDFRAKAPTKTSR